MSKSIKKNYLYNLIYQALILIVPLITTPYLSRALGAEAIGIYSYTISITTYFVLFGSLGIALYGQREIAYVQDDKEKRSTVFLEILLMRFITLGISMLIFYLSFVKQGQYSIYYKILILEIISNSIDISWFFQGIEEFKKTVVRNAIVKIISVICIFIFVKNTNDLLKYFIIYVLSTFLGNLSLWMYLPKYIEKVNLKNIKIFKHLKPAIALFIPQIAVQIYTVLDKTMIGAIVEDKAEVGFYEQSQKIVKLLLAIATSLGTVMSPRMASTFAKGDKEKIKEYLNKSFAFLMMLAFPLMFGMVSVASKFVPVFYGNGYDKVITLINIIIPIILIIGFSNAIGSQYLLPTKKQKEYTTSVVAGAIVNVLLNLILIKNWQSIGASIATVIAECTVTGLQIYFIRKEIDVLSIFKMSKKYFIASIPMFIVSLFLGRLIDNNIVSIIVQAFCGAIVYFVVLLCFRDDMILEGIEIIKNPERSRIQDFWWTITDSNR